jgi:hypothetical protein
MGRSERAFCYCRHLRLGNTQERLLNCLSKLWDQMITWRRPVNPLKMYKNCKYFGTTTVQSRQSGRAVVLHVH